MSILGIIGIPGRMPFALANVELSQRPTGCESKDINQKILGYRELKESRITCITASMIGTVVQSIIALAFKSISLLYVTFAMGASLCFLSMVVSVCLTISANYEIECLEAMAKNHLPKSNLNK
jgi:hypothetical protein